MTDKLTTKQLSPIAIEIWDIVLRVISTEGISTAEDIAEEINVDKQYVLELLNNDDFYNAICANSLNNMRLAYHSKAIPGLIQRLDTDKDFFDAHDRLSKAIGAVKERDTEGMKVSLEVLLKKAEVKGANTDRREEKNVTPHTKDLNSVSKVTGNIFALDETEDKSISSHIDFQWDDEE